MPPACYLDVSLSKNISIRKEASRGHYALPTSLRMLFVSEDTVFISETMQN